MGNGIRNEIDYLGSRDRDRDNYRAFAEEMVRRLDALRRYDQDFDERDWQPNARETGWQPYSPL